MHWIGAEFCVCMFLDFRNKSLNMLNFVGTIKKKKKPKKNNGSVLVVESGYNSQNAQFGLVMILFLRSKLINAVALFLSRQ